MDAVTTNTSRRQRVEFSAESFSDPFALPARHDWSAAPIVRAWKTFREGTASLAEKPFALVLVLLAVRLLTSPFGGFVHDAQLYGIQSLHRSTGNAYAGDLFFLFGSQDEYSIFSLVMAPLVQAFGLPVAFFLGFLASVTLFLVAQTSLILRLVSDRFLAVLTLVILTVCELPYGGWSIFQVHESFLTARLPATALVLLAIDRLLAQRVWQAWLCLFIAMSIHPLMSLPGAGILICWHLGQARPRVIRLATGIVSCLALIGGVGMVLSGRWKPMDAEWLAIVRGISPQCFPLDWMAEDWANILFAVATLLVVTQTMRPELRWLSISAVVVGLGGLALSIFAEVFPIPILIQVQPMRALWLTEFFAVALAPLLAIKQWQTGTSVGKLLAILLTVWICRLRPPYMWDEGLYWVMAASMVGAAVMAVNMFSLSADRTNQRWTAGFVAVVAACAVSSVINTVGCLQSLDQLTYIGDSVALYYIAIRIVGDFLPLVIATIIVMLVVAHHSSTRGMLPRAIAFAGIAILLTGLFRITTDAPRDTEGLPFVRGTVASADRLPNVYWPTDIRNIWFGIPARSYYHFAQVQGALFRRDTAIEARRRMDLVRPFEMRELRSLGQFIPWERLGRVYGPTERSKPVVAADVLTLATEPDLDFIVLPYNVPSLPSKHQDGVWIYDCAALRRQVRSIQANRTLETLLIATKENSAPWNP